MGSTAENCSIDKKNNDNENKKSSYDTLKSEKGKSLDNGSRPCRS